MAFSHMKKIAAACALLINFLYIPLAQASPHAAGTNIKLPDGTIAMITADGKVRPYTSAGAFLSYGLNSFRNIATANADDSALPKGDFIPPQDGKIVCSDRGSDKGTCYLISQGRKSAFTSSSVFSQLGFKFSRGTSGDVSFMQTGPTISDGNAAHLPGVLINSKGTVLLVGPDSLLGIPSVATFESWGYTFMDVVNANPADMQKPQSGSVMPQHQAGALSPFDTLPSSGANGSANPITTAPVASKIPWVPATTASSTMPIYPNSSTLIGAVTVSTDTSTPAAQSLPMSTKQATLAIFHVQETSGNETVVLKGLTVTALAAAGTTVGNSAPNTSYDTLKNFTLSDGTTTITRSGWANGTVPLTGSRDAQAYLIDFSSGNPLNFAIPANGSLTLTLRADINDWSGNASANSNWNFTVAKNSALAVTGASSQQPIPVTLTGSVSNGTTVTLQQVQLKAVSTLSRPFVQAPATGTFTLQDVVGIFNVLSPSTLSYLNSISIQQSGSALPSAGATTTPVTYFVYDASVDLSHFIGTVTLPNGVNTADIPLNLNSAGFKGVRAPTDGSAAIVITADTTNFASSSTYSLAVTNWQWQYDVFPGVINTPTGTTASVFAVYGSKAATSRSY